MSQQLRILALNWRCLRHPQAGGSELNLFEQARRWARAGHAVTVLCADPGRAAAPCREEEIDGILVRRMGGRLTVYLWAALFLLCYASRFDRIIDVSNGIPFFAPLFTRRRGVLLVHHVHGAQWKTECGWALGGVGWALERWAVPLIYRRWVVVTVSPSTYDTLIGLGVRPEQLHVVYNGLSASLPPSSAAPLPGRRVLYLGRIKRYKRLELLVHAVDALRRSIPDVHLDIAGDGDARPEIAALVDRLSLGRHVTFHGFVDEQLKADLLASATVFATASMHEGWGLAVIEANAYACPAVAFDVPGLRVAIRQGETGLLVPDEPTFRRALEALLLDRSLRERLACGAWRWSRQFNWDSSAAATLALLDRAAEASRTAAVLVAAPERSYRPDRLA